MSISNVVSCEFPSTIVLIDDSMPFLNSITFDLDDTVSFKLFQKPYKALQFLKEEYRSPLEVYKEIQASSASTDLKNKSIDINIQNILKLIHTPKRFDTISVVVVDYAMPSINGIDVCKQLQDLPVKKVLLTGEADHHIAVEAFNNNIIDQFIRKDDLNFRQNFNDIIKGLQHDFFCDISKNLIANLALHEDCALAKPELVTHLNIYKQQYRLLESYLIDTQGSYLLLDANAAPYWFIVRSDEQIEQMTVYAYENDASEKIKRALREREEFLYAGLNTNFKDIPMSEWSSHLCLCKPLNKDQYDFVYAKLSPGYTEGINAKDIVSYNAFLKR